MNNIQFYQSHLNKVSRSFAFCIARLEGEMREWVGLSYLLCRLLDTVEDAPWDSPIKQASSFNAFESFIEQKESAEIIISWASEFPNNIPENEKKLLSDAPKIFSDLHQLSASVQKKIRQSVLNMLRGMRHFTQPTQGPKKIYLHNLAEVNQYCFFVAGLVGELLTDLAFEKHPNEPRLNDLRLKSIHFGLFLQKINILKDQREDEIEGRFLVHSRTEVLSSLKKDAENAIQYILSLPVTEKGYRLFCAWCLFLGLASLPWIQKSWAMGMLKKIPRLMTEKILNTVELHIDDNAALLKLFRKKLPRLPNIILTSEITLPTNWFLKAYVGALSASQLEELGLLSK